MKVKPFLNQALTRISDDESETPGTPETGNPVIRCADYPMPGEVEADKILFGARDEVIKGGVFHFTPETQAAEAEVNQTYKAILDGGRGFAALRAACARWVEVARKPPAPPVMASLFEGLKK
jgi:hypothetical protein